MVRIQLTNNTSIKNPIASKIIVVDSYDALVKQASSKFKFPPSKLRLFVAKQTIDAPLGTELKSNDDFIMLTCDDILLAVSNGNDFKRKVVKNKQLSHDILQKITMPPRHPYPGKQSDCHTSMAHGITLSDEIVSSDYKSTIIYSAPKDTNYKKELNGLFPVLDGNVLSLIKKTILSYDKITETENDGYVSFDYDDNMIFPELKSWEDHLVRECRGLIVSTITGKILARRFHKFFNIDEKNESILSTINFSDAKIYEKLDGSLVSPILLDNGNLIWATRKNRNLEVESFVLSSNNKYNAFAMHCLTNNTTPLFEWCHDSHAVGVLCYPEKQLILLALRHNVTGDYIDIKEYLIKTDMSIPTVQQIEFDDTMGIVESIRKLVNKEGAVVYTKDGNMYKLKSKWYINMVSSLSSGQKMFLPEFVKKSGTLKTVPKDKIFIAAIENDDDSIALALSTMSSKEATEFRDFVNHVQKNIGCLENQLKQWTIDNFKITLDKDPLICMAESFGWPADIISDIFDKKSITNKLKSFLIDLAKKKKTDVLVELIDIDWIDGADQDSAIDITLFQKCSEDIKIHVLTKYLNKKFSNMFGLKQMTKDTIVNIPDNYSSDEGRIIGMWEKFEVVDLRIDLQPKRKEYSEHYGNSEYALFLVQYGPIGNDGSAPHGEFAGILLPTNCDFSFDDITNAFKKSFDTLKIIKMRRRVKLALNYKIFCDLDGVLVDFEKGVFDVTGRHINDQPTSKMWQRVLTYPKFFESLDWTPYGPDMWKQIIDIGKQTPTILTGTPSSTKKHHETGKREWCKNHLGPDVEVITCNSAEKYKYASNGHILIDDRLEMGKQWSAYGGIFIHHISPERTIHELKRLFGKLIKTNLEIVETCDLEMYHTDKIIHMISNDWEEIKSDIISIDSEWNPDGLTSDISIIQICTPTDVYIIDMLNCTEIVKERLHDIFTNNDIKKLCFGLDTGECFRIGCDISNIFDIQEMACDIFSNFFTNSPPSLSLLVSSLLGKKLGKSKEYQAGNWNTRPLSDEQITYAINDVAVLFELYDVITSKYMHFIPSKNIHLEKTQIVKRTKNDFDPLVPVRIIYSGIFLTPSSKSQLLTMFGPTNTIVYCDHLTLKYMPFDYELRGLKVGETVAIKVIGYYADKKIQTIKCEYDGKDIYHITISTAPAVSPTESNDITDWSIIKPFNIYGTVGVMTQLEEDQLCGLPEKVKDKIMEFVSSATWGETLKFKSSELSASERSMVHEYAKNNGMVSESTGKDDERRLTLTMKRRNTYTEDNNKKVQTKITDMFRYSTMNVLSNEYDIVSHGRITSDKIVDISTKLETALNTDKKVIILRGIVGSGKSSLAKLISSMESSIICSADDYFVEDGEYKFDKNKLESAHGNCFELFCNSIDKEISTIIVDNTNSKLSEYKKYIDVANLRGYLPIVLEIYCKDRNQAVKFSRLGTHNVSTNDALKMLSKWESDDNAFLLLSYMNSPKDNFSVGETFYQWMCRMKFIHHNKMRKKTHMHMQVGSIPLFFIDVPQMFINQFLEVYAKTGIQEGDNYEPKYIMEVPITPWSDKFKMYFDIDYIDTCILPNDDIITMVKILQKIINNDVYVTYCISDETERIKTGLHFNCPNTLVDMGHALDMRRKYVELLIEHDSSKNWSAIVDESVYSNERGSRMFGSRKTTRGIDVGRLYKIKFALDKNGDFIGIPTDDLELLKILSTQIF
jgi:T4 RnlA family RNA ligase